MIDRVVVLYDGKVEFFCLGMIGVLLQVGYVVKYLVGLGEKVIWFNYCFFYYVFGCGLRGFLDMMRYRFWFRLCICKLVWWKLLLRIYVYD